MWSRLAPTLLDVYPHQHPFPRDNWQGMGIFSRHPVRSISPPEYAPLGCSCQQAEVELDGRVVTLVNVHPRPPRLEPVTFWHARLPLVFTTGPQEPALDAVLERIDRANAPLILAGDLNTSDRQPYYSRVRQRLRDAFREGGRGFGFTFPSAPAGLPIRFPVVRIDYIFHDQAWTALAAWTGRLAGSDHRYVVADLVLN
jgi:endonuclease/exonuclease/phosphatase (EEP) superfamily protein YafD